MASPISFNANWYLSQNPDVAAAIQAGLFDAETHFQQYGRTEGRSGSFLLDVEYYLANNPDVATAVQAGAITAWDHALQQGVFEGRLLTPLFDETFYLQHNPDIAQAVGNGLITSGLQHFVLFGHAEQRAINPMLDLGKYLAANPDVAQAASGGFITPLAHLMNHGITEGRDLGNGVRLTDFSNDPLFTQAVGNNSHMDAWLRVGAVAPFVPTFERPAGWTPPANTFIPVDFRAPSESNLKLVVPSEVVVPTGVTLSDQVFLLDGRPAPAPVTPGGGGGGGNPAPPFEITLVSGAATLPATNGNVSITQDNDNYIFTPANGSPFSIPKNGITTITVPPGISLNGSTETLRDLITSPYPDRTITGAITVNDTISVADIDTIAGATTGVVTATLEAGNLSSFSALSDAGNAYTIDINDSSSATLTAADLKALSGKTTGTVTVTNGAKIQGAYDDVVAALVTGADGGTKILAPTSPITISDASGTSFTAANLRALGGATSGDITITKEVTIEGTAADMKAALLDADTKVIAGSAKLNISDTLSVADANALAATTTGIVTAALQAGNLASFESIEPGNAYTITLNEAAGTGLSASALSGLGGKTSGTVTLANAVAISGTEAEMTAALVTDSTRVEAPTAVVTITDANGTSLTATALSAIGGKTSGTVTVQNAVTVSGTAAEMTAALVTEGTRVEAPTAIVNITDANGTSLKATDLSAIGGKTSGTVTVNNAVTISGTTNEIKSALIDEATKVIAATANITVSDTLSVTDANTIAALTTGIVTATLATGELASFNNLEETGNAYTITVNDAAGTSLAAATLSALGGKTTGTVTVSHAVSITGTAAQVTGALVTPATLVVANSADVTVTGSVTATDIQAIEAKTTGVVTASLSGSLSTFTALESGNNAYTITITDYEGAEVSAPDLSALGGKTTGTVTVNNAVVISGTPSQLMAALVTEETKVTATTAKVKVTDASTVTANDLAAIHSATMGTVTIEGTAGGDNYTDLANFAAGDLIINGNAGNDIITGGKGNDILTGGAGNDTIIGGDGNDSITGGIGDDTLTGGAGNDIFVYAVGDGTDTITDFVSGTDKYDTNFATASNNFTFAAESTRKIGTNDGLILNTGSYGVFEIVDKFTGNGNATLDIDDFTNAEDIMIAIDWDQKIATTNRGDNFLLILRDTTSSKSYLYQADDSAGSEYFEPQNSSSGDTLTLVAIFENTNLAGGDII